MSICKIRSLDRSQCSSFCIYCRDDLLFDVYQTVMMVLVVSLRHLLIAFAFVKVNDQPFIIVISFAFFLTHLNRGSGRGAPSMQATQIKQKDAYTKNIDTQKSNNCTHIDETE